MSILVPESFFDLGKANLAGETKIFALRAFPACREFGHRRDPLTAGIAGPDSISLHMAMVARSRSYPRVG
jgi:hypothetical protein